MEIWRLLAHRHWFTLRAFGSELRLCSRCSGYLAGFLFLTASRSVIGLQALQALLIQHQFIIFMLEPGFGMQFRGFTHLPIVPMMRSWEASPLPFPLPRPGSLIIIRLP
jgi:hypothetical protein